MAPKAKPSARRAERTDDGRFDGAPTPTGFAPLKHKPKVFANPTSFAGRRAASRLRYTD